MNVGRVFRPGEQRARWGFKIVPSMVSGRCVCIEVLEDRRGNNLSNN